MTAVLRLDARGPLALLDAALAMARAAPAAELRRAWAGGLAVVVPALVLFFAEYVEQVRSLRLLAAVALVGGFVFRAVALSEVAGSFAQRTLGDVSQLDRSAPRSEAARTALWAACFLLAWLSVPAAASIVGVWLVPAAMLALSLRGAIAPSWLLRARIDARGGLRSLHAAWLDTSETRAELWLVELLVLVGALVTFANLWALTSTLVLIGGAGLGLDTTTALALLSPRNTAAWVLFGAATFVLFEPVRAAQGATAYLVGRVRRDALDLVALAAALGRRTGTRRGGLARAAVVACFMANPALARAVPTAAEVEATVDTVLADDTFRETEDDRGRSLADALERAVARWLAREEKDAEAARRLVIPTFPVPPPELLVALIASVVIVVAAVFFWRNRRARRVPSTTPPGAAEVQAILAVSASEWRERAARWAAEGRAREAVRALYWAAIVALDRRGRIAFERSQTNRELVRALRGDAAERDFDALARLFERAWFGDKPVDATLAERAFAHADAIVGRELPT